MSATDNVDIASNLHALFNLKLVMDALEVLAPCTAQLVLLRDCQLLAQAVLIEALSSELLDLLFRQGLCSQSQTVLSRDVLNRFDQFS